MDWLSKYDGVIQCAKKAEWLTKKDGTCRCDAGGSRLLSDALLEACGYIVPKSKDWFMERSPMKTVQP
jgi:hypothetical protein